MLSRFHEIPERDGLTDTKTELLYRAIKNDSVQCINYFVGDIFGGRGCRKHSGLYDEINFIINSAIAERPRNASCH